MLDMLLYLKYVSVLGKNFPMRKLFFILPKFLPKCFDHKSYIINTKIVYLGRKEVFFNKKNIRILINKNIYIETRVGNFVLFFPENFDFFTQKNRVKKMV